MARKPIEVEALRHAEARRRNIPTAEYESVMREEDKSPVRLAYERRNRDLDPQLVWRGKDEQDWSDLIVSAPPLYIQEKVHPKVLIDDLKAQARRRRAEAAPETPDLFADFNGLPDDAARTEFYQHDANWSNRMISGDSLSVMASLAEREGLRGQVQCIYIDPPYGIKFNSNFQWSTTSRDVKDGAKDHVTREPEQVRAFRDTWRDGIHSYLTYLRDRLTVARDLLHESGSIFVQIGDENVHRVRALMDEVFGDENFVSQTIFRKTTGKGSSYLDNTYDVVLWYAKTRDQAKYRTLYFKRRPSDDFNYRYERNEAGQLRPLHKEELDRIDDIAAKVGVAAANPMTSQSSSTTTLFEYDLNSVRFAPGKGGWKTNLRGMERLRKACRLFGIGRTLRFIRPFSDFDVQSYNDVWDDTRQSGFGDDKVYVVQTATRVVERCIHMTTDPGDLVLDPTCGSGTTATVAEQWGRRWITIDTSRVALALARSRLMGARYPYYILADSPEGLRKEAQVTRTPPRDRPTRGDIRHGFVYERVPHITLKSIANNAEIDVIWDQWKPRVEDALASLNGALKGHATPYKAATGGRAGKAIDFAATGTMQLPSGDDVLAGALLDWEVPREAPANWPEATQAPLAAFWEARIGRQKEIDAAIAARAESEYLYDKPYIDNSRIRVAGPFTVESLSPHRTLAVDWDDELIEPGLRETGPGTRHDGPAPEKDFAGMILEQLKAAGVQQAHKEDRITFTSLAGWPGSYICAEAAFMEGASAEGGKGDRPPAGQAAPAEASAHPTGVSAKVKRAGIFIGPEFGTVSRPDLVAAAREAGDAGFDVLIACAFNYDAHAGEFDKLGRVPVLKARMNPDLHMGGDLKATGAGNLFVIFGEPDIKIEEAGADSSGNPMIRVKVFGVDVFKPQTGEVVSEDTDGIALWMLDTDYNEESFFVRHAYFLGANDPYKALKTTLKAEIDQEAWETLHSDVSRPFPKPPSGRIAVKVINHLGDEVMKVFGVE